MRRTVPPSAEIEEQIDELFAVGVGDNPRESLSELAKLGARLIIQRAVEEEFDAWLGRARYERRPECQRGLRNGFRPRKLQTAEGELSAEIPQVREAAEPFVSKLFPRGTKLLRTEPLGVVIGAFVRGLSMRDVESLCEQAGLGKLSKSTASRICQELRERFEAFKRRDLYEVRLAALFLDATFVAVRPEGPKEGVLVAWGEGDDLSQPGRFRVRSGWLRQSPGQAWAQASSARASEQRRRWRVTRTSQSWWRRTCSLSSPRRGGSVLLGRIGVVLEPDQLAAPRSAERRTGRSAALELGDGVAASRARRRPQSRSVARPRKGVSPRRRLSLAPRTRTLG